MAVGFINVVKDNTPGAPRDLFAAEGAGSEGAAAGGGAAGFGAVFGAVPAEDAITTRFIDHGLCVATLHSPEPVP